MKVLVSWIGITDLEAAGARTPKSGGSPGAGPLGQALEKRVFDRVVLLTNFSKSENSTYLKWARERTNATIELKHVDLTDPTDFERVYKLGEQVLANVRTEVKDKRSEWELTLHLSSGTPAMFAVWVLLGKTKYPAELIQTSKEAGVRTTAVPLDIAAEFIDLIPKLIRGPDASLAARADGGIHEAPQFGDIVYRCNAMGELIGRARRLVSRSVSVLIEGESGTGKELLARAIHQEGTRKNKPFIAVNCGALPKDLVEALLFGHVKGAFTGANKPASGHFREAEGGTLFLDEVGELPLAAQVKLLRVLQEKKVTPVGDSKEHSIDVRIIAATNRNLASECQAGRFREDLFYRLALAILRPPPLRERQGDVGFLIENLLEKANDIATTEEPGYERKKLSAGAKRLLLAHPWPGNVRELENTLMRATVWTEGTTITEHDMRGAMLTEPASKPDAVRLQPLDEGFSLDATLDSLSRDYIRAALKQAGDNKSQAAKLLGLNSRQTLNNRMEALGLSS